MKKQKHSNKTIADLKNIDRVEPCITNTKVHNVLKDYFTYCLHKSALLLRQRLTEKLLPLKIALPHLSLLRFLEQLGTQSQNQLGEQLSIDKATMVKLIDYLEKLKLVLRTQNLKDRRVWQIQVTAQGLKVLQKSSVIRTQLESEFLSCLTQSQKKIMLECMPILLDRNRHQ